MLKFNPQTYKKAVTLLKEGGYQVRSGKGNFNSGYCLLAEKKVIVINSYHSVEAKINAIIEIIDKISLNEDNLSTISTKLLADIRKYSQT